MENENLNVKSQLILKKVKHTLWITLNRPETSNAITYEMIASLTNSLREADQDSTIRVIIITGEGKNFCSGGDLNNMMNKAEMFAGESNELRQRYEHGIQQISRVMESISKPIIAVVNGSAAGAGCDLACMCDMRLGASTTQFMESFVKIGLVPGDGGTFFLQRVVGYAKAVELTLTGRVVAAEEAEKIGLLNKIVDINELKNEAQKLADLISSNAPVAVQMSKKALKIGYLHDLSASLDLLSAYQGIAQRTEDHYEALKSITEKRKPDFKGY